MRPLNRPAPTLPAENMVTHQIVAPLSTHFRRATCEEVDCAAWRHGWLLPLTGLDEQDRHLARTSGRRFTVCEVDGQEALQFEAGQSCFKASTHRVSLEREPVFLVQDGDYRGNPRRTQPLVLPSADAWKNHLGEHLDTIRNI